jgi:hypothetical protein
MLLQYQKKAALKDKLQQIESYLDDIRRTIFEFQKKLEGKLQNEMKIIRFIPLENKDFRHSALNWKSAVRLKSGGNIIEPRLQSEFENVYDFNTAALKNNLAANNLGEGKKTEIYKTLFNFESAKLDDCPPLKGFIQQQIEILYKRINKQPSYFNFSDEDSEEEKQNSFIMPVKRKGGKSTKDMEVVVKMAQEVAPIRSTSKGDEDHQKDDAEFISDDNSSKR